MRFFYPLLIVITILFNSFLSAQVTIRGTVTDAVTHEHLVGANVIVVGTPLGASSDIQGNFKINNVRTGTVSLRVSYIGYKQKEMTLNNVNADAIVNIALLPDALLGTEVLVTGQALGQAAAINQQITSNTIINVISEEKIQELPDVNAAEAIGRLPGVALLRSGGEANRVVLRGMSDRFSTITVDGVKLAPTDENTRGVDLSTISQGSLAGIELYKAITADKDADAIAGSVNLVTKKAPAQRLLWLDSKGAYNQLNKNLGQYDFSLRYGERFFDNILGLQVNGNLERRDRSREKFEVAYNTNAKNGTDYEITNFTLDFTKEIRKRSGFSILMDINTPDSGTIKINNIFNLTNRNYIDYTRNYPTNSSNDLKYGARDREQEIGTFNSSVRGENYIMPDLQVNWTVSFAQSKAEYPFDFELNFLEPSTDSSRMKPIPIDYFKGPLEDLSKYAWNNFQRAYLNLGYDRGEKNLDIEKTAMLDFTKQFVIEDVIFGEIKIGGKYRYKSRFKEASELLAPYYNIPFPGYVRLSDGTIVAKNFTGTRFNSLSMVGGKILVTNFLDPSAESRDLYDKYFLYPMLNRDALQLWRDLNIRGVSTTSGSGIEYNRNLETDAYYYDITERVAAGYLMGTFRYGQDVTLIAGVRVESEDNDYRSRYSPTDLTGFPTPQGNLYDTSAHHSERVWLPNFHLTMRPTDYLNIRIAAYKALARPDFNHRLENFVARKAGTFYPDNSLFVGNPGLKAAQAMNYELNTSVFGNELGLISVSAFYKDIKDMYHIMNGVVIEGAPTEIKHIMDSLGINWTVPTYGVPVPRFYFTYPYNSPKTTKVWGFEFEHQMNFLFLGESAFKNIVLSYNFSLVRSETYIAVSKTIRWQDSIEIIPGLWIKQDKSKAVLTEQKQKLEGQPEFFCNVSLGYDWEGLSARLSYFYQGAFNQSFSGDAKSDEIVNSFQRWDFALKYTYSEHLSFMLNLNNINRFEEQNSENNRIFGWQLLTNSEQYGMTADLGVRLAF